MERCASIRSTMRSSTCGQIEVRGSAPAAEPSNSAVGTPSSRMSSTGTTTETSNGLVRRRLHHDGLGGAAEEAGDLLDRAHGGRQPDALGGLLQQRVEALEGERQVRAALGGGDRVDLVDDDGLDAGQRLPGPRGEDQEQRLRGGDEDVRRPGGEPRRSSAGVSPERTPTSTVGSGSPRRCAAWRMPVSGRAQVALDVDGERLERGDVEHPAAPLPLGRGRAWRSGCRARTGTRPGSCPTRWGRRPARAGPERMASHAPTWAAVGASKAPANQSRVAGANPASGIRDGRPSLHPARRYRQSRIAVAAASVMS